MRLTMMLRDKEYRDAMIEMISEYDKEIFIEVADGSGASRDSVILTDVEPEEIGSETLASLAARTVFISARHIGEDNKDTVHRVFKYSSTDNIMAEISMVYYTWTGDAGAISPLSRSIAVCSEYDSGISDRCRSLARQIIYRIGGSVLILPLGFINDYQVSEDCSEGLFRKLMYYIDSGRDYPAECLTAGDSYGISYLRLRPGPNPAAYLDEDNLGKLIRSVGSRFDTVLLDAGTSYSRNNIDAISRADNIVYFGNGRRIPDLASYIGREQAERARIIRLTGETDEAMQIDETVREIYGIGEEINENERHSAQIRR